MTVDPADDQLTTKPFWTVQAVFDPDGQGGDFAYTIGLHDRGFPELHMRARPGLGHDPGLDWKFSPHDQTRILNELAGMVIRCDLSVGSTFARVYDGGLARMDFRIDPPERREELEAYGTAPDAVVLPVRWSLDRAPEGPLSDLVPAKVAWAETRYRQLAVGRDVSKAAPHRWELPALPSFDASQRFGPLTPLVLARLRQLSEMSPRDVPRFLDLALGVEHWVGLSYPATRARALGRPAGRSEALDRLEEEVDRVMPWESSDFGLRRAWQREMAEMREGLDAETARRVESNCRYVLPRAARDLLFTQAVEDLADTETMLHGFGPWDAVRAGARTPWAGRARTPRRRGGGARTACPQATTSCGPSGVLT